VGRRPGDFAGTAGGGELMMTLLKISQDHYFSEHSGYQHINENYCACRKCRRFGTKKFQKYIPNSRTIPPVETYIYELKIFTYRNKYYYIFHPKDEPFIDLPKDGWRDKD